MMHAPPTRVPLFVALPLALVVQARHCGALPPPREVAFEQLERPAGQEVQTPMSLRPVLALLLLSACNDPRPVDPPLPEWGEECDPTGGCADGFECNTSEGWSQLGYCSQACDANIPCSTPGEICNAEGACTVPCQNEWACPVADVSLQCVHRLCVGTL